MTATGRAVVRHVLVLAALAGAVACHDKNPAGPSPVPSPVPSPSSPVAQSIAIGGTLSLHQPGDTGQLTATATFSDGTTKDVTAEALWGSTGSAVIVSLAGLVTAGRYGSSEIVVTCGTAHQSIAVRVAPEGAFLMEGTVTDTGHPVGQAKVDATFASGTYSTLTDASGAFVLPGAGAVTLQVSKYGYDTAVRQVTVDRDDRVTLELRQGQQAGTIPGRYTVTFIASPSCTLPPEARQRTYGALIEEGRVYHASEDLDVTLDGANLVFGWGGDAGFTGTVDGNTVRFAITDDLMNGYYAFIERIGNMDMHYQGTATGTLSDRAIVTRFNGTVLLRSGTTTVGVCSAADHRLEFAR
jgi:hypothetical protein